MRKLKPLFPKLAEAMRLHDERLEELIRIMWDRVDDDDKLTTVQHLTKVALDSLHLAFHDDTKKVNSLDHCRLLSIERLSLLAKMTNEKRSNVKTK